MTKRNLVLHIVLIAALVGMASSRRAATMRQQPRRIWREQASFVWYYSGPMPSNVQS